MHQLDTPGDERRASADEEGVGPLSRERRESYLDRATAVGAEDLELSPEGRAAVSTSFNVASAARGSLVTSTATREARGSFHAGFPAVLPPTLPSEN